MNFKIFKLFKNKKIKTTVIGNYSNIETKKTVYFDKDRISIGVAAQGKSSLYDELFIKIPKKMKELSKISNKVCPPKLTFFEKLRTNCISEIEYEKLLYKLVELEQKLENRVFISKHGKNLNSTTLDILTLFRILRKFGFRTMNTIDDKEEQAIRYFKCALLFFDDDNILDDLKENDYQILSSKYFKNGYIPESINSNLLAKDFGIDKMIIISAVLPLANLLQAQVEAMTQEFKNI